MGKCNRPGSWLPFLFVLVTVALPLEAAQDTEEERVVHLVEAGSFEEAIPPLLERVNKPDVSQQVLRAAAVAFYFTNRTAALEELLLRHPAAFTGSGPHSVALSLFHLDRNEYEEGVRRALEWLDDPEWRGTRRLRDAVRLLESGGFSAALTALGEAKAAFPADDQVLLRLEAYAAARAGNHSLAYQSAVRALTNAGIERISIEQAQALFSLALRGKNGPEAVLWGNHLQEKSPRLAGNGPFANNMAMAYVFLAQSVPAGETRTGHATLSRQWVEAALKILRSDPVYHTASLAAEMQGDLEAAFQYIELARALKPDNQEYQTRSRELRRRREQGRGN